MDKQNARVVPSAGKPSTSKRLLRENSGMDPNDPATHRLLDNEEINNEEDYEGKHRQAANNGSQAEDQPQQQQQPITSSATCDKLTGRLSAAVLVCAIGSSFQHGYNGGVVNAPEKFIGQFINDTYFKRHGQPASDTQQDLIFSLIVAIFCVGGFFGALGTAYVAEHIGRRQGLFYNNLLTLVACPMMASSKFLSSWELLILGRFLVGIQAGLSAGLAPLYLNEIAPSQLRGALGTSYQLIITFSILVSNLVGLPCLLGTTFRWPVMFVLPILPAIIALIALPRCPESPKFLLLNQGRELEAQQALGWFRETYEVHDEMEELRTEHEVNKLTPVITLKDIWHQNSLRRPLIIAVVVMLSQQLCGINAILFFSTTIFRIAGLSEKSSIEATLGMSLINVLVTTMSLILIDKTGRRNLHLGGLVGMGIACFVLGTCLGSMSESDQEVTGFPRFLIIGSVYLYIAMFASGPGSIPWFLITELFPSSARSVASSVAVAANWSANFTISLCFLPLTNLLHGHVFYIFTALMGCFYLFVFYKVPETRGATPEEIASLFY